MSARAGAADRGASDGMAVVAYSAQWRTLAALLRVVGTASLLVVLLALALPGGAAVHPLRLIRFVLILCVLPGAAVLLGRWSGAGVLRIDHGSLVLAQRHRRVEIPIANIAAIEPWRVPLPGSGVWLRLRSGRRWRDGIELDDPRLLVAALAAGGGAPHLLDVARDPALIYAHARSRVRRRPWYRPLLDFPLFALVPTVPLFRVHQIIAYGGAFGEYYQYGLWAYVAGFAIRWAIVTIYLMVYATALRVPVEALAAVTAVLAPTWALTLRRGLERTVAVLYYAGVPVAVALRFVPW